MFGALLKKIFGSSNDRRLKGYRPKVAAINALEAEFAALSDEQLRAKTEEFRAEIAAGKSLDELLAPAFAAVREAAKRTLKQRHFDVQLIGGMVLARGRHRRDAHRRRQDPGRHAGRLSERARRQRRPCRHGQRLSRQPRLRVDGADLRLSRHERRRHRARARRRPAAAILRRRHHLRHQQRIRLRLSARQHEIRHVADGAARPRIRHRRRGRLHPGRRGAHAADHFRSVGGSLRSLRQRERADSAAGPRGLRHRRKAAHGEPDRGRQRARRGDAARGRHHEGGLALRGRQRDAGPSREPGVARA